MCEGNETKEKCLLDMEESVNYQGSQQIFTSKNAEMRSVKTENELRLVEKKNSLRMPYSNVNI